MNNQELAELQRLAPSPGKVPTREKTDQTIPLSVLGFVQRLPDRTWRLTNKGMDCVTSRRIDAWRAV